MSTEIGDDKEWEPAFDSDSRIYWVNHRLKTTQWLHPKITKPASFADCSGDQLPYGWEKLHDPKIGSYYTNHIERMNQLEDPRIEWKNKKLQMLNNYIQRAGNSNNHPIYQQTKCSDHHKSCLEVSPPKHNLPSKFSSRPNLTSSNYTDSSGQCNTMTSCSFQINKFKPTTMGGSISSLPNDIMTHNIPGDHLRADTVPTAQVKSIQKTVPPNYKEIRWSHEHVPVIDGQILSSDDNLTYSNGPSNRRLVEPADEQFVCHHSHNQLCKKELASSLCYSPNHDLVGKMVAPKRSISDDCPDVSRISQEADVNYDQANSKSECEFRNNLDSETVVNQTTPSLQKSQSLVAGTSTHTNSQELSDNSQTKVSHQREELDHEPFLKRMDMFYKIGSSHSVEV